MSANPNTKISSRNSEWKKELSESYTSLKELSEAGLLSPSELLKLEAIGQKYQIRITRYYAGLMAPNADCPIKKQALPHLGEEDPVLPQWAVDLSQKVYKRPTPWLADAIGDVRNLAAPRLTHRYHNRAILHLSTVCALYCRFCFRKSHLNEEESALYEGSLEPALEYLRSHSEIQELILTGGDPLSVTDFILERLFKQLSEISHIRIVRIHSRMAVTLPSRFTPELLEILSRNWGFQIYLVSHFNHPKELTQESKSALHQLRKTGITLLNQTVLLRGINNQIEVLKDLIQSLYENGVIPFYLHHPDWTPGTFHFRVGIEEGKTLAKNLRGILPGPAVPHYVLDIPQGYGKTPIMDSDFKKVEEFSLLNKASIRGALYEVISPSTRISSPEKILYLDLFPA